MRVLTICNGYPSKVDPARGPFIADQVKWLRTVGVDSVVVKPNRLGITKGMVIPGQAMARSWKRWLFFFQMEREGIVNGQPVYYPRNICLPERLFLWSARETLYWQTRHLFDRVVKEFEPAVIHSHFMTPNAFLGQKLSARYRIPHITSIMGSDADRGLQGGARAVTEWTLRNIDGVITKSSALKEKMIANYGIDPGRIRVIFNGVDLAKFAPQESPVESGDEKRILFVGSLQKVKDVAGNLLPAIARLDSRRGSDFRLHLVGDGVEEPRIRAAVAELRISHRVSFLGRCSHEEIAAHYGRADVVVLSSRREGTPNVLMEAMACGAPVVSTAVGGVTDIVTDRSGLTVPPGEPEALAIALDEALRKRWDRDAIREHALAEFDIRNKVREIKQFYIDVGARH